MTSIGRGGIIRPQVTLQSFSSDQRQPAGGGPSSTAARWPSSFHEPYFNLQFRCTYTYPPVSTDEPSSFYCTLQFLLYPPVSTYEPSILYSNLQFLCTYVSSSLYLRNLQFLLYPQTQENTLNCLHMYPKAQDNTGFGFEIGFPKQIWPQEFLTEVEPRSRTAVGSKTK